MADDLTNENEAKTPENDPSISSELIRGHINTIILRTLYDGDKYGYEIINEIEAKSKGQYSLKQPTLYSALKRLETQDFVTSYWGGASGGGRRKYFQITEKGRNVVEQNLAEWEYSRTIIDNLISQKEYDFNNPPPSHSVDFNLLKQSTTRIHASRANAEEDEDEAEAPFLRQPAAENTVGNAEESAETSGENNAAEGTGAAREEISNASDGSAAAQETARPEAKPHVLTPEEQQRIHENYRALIGENGDAEYYEQVRRNEEEQRRQQEAPRSEAAAEFAAAEQSAPVYDDEYERNRAISSELLYANRPAEERNYKELIARLYDNTRHGDPAEDEPPQTAVQESPAPAAEPAPPAPAPVPQRGRTAGNIEFYDVEEQAETDGLRVTTATGRRSRGTAMQKADTAGTFDKGRLLFITALWVFGVALVESIINACLSGMLASGAAYAVLPFVFSVAFLCVFLILFLRGYGRRSKKVKSKSYVSATLIVYVNVVLIICLIAFLVIGFSGTITARSILLYAVFPCIFLFNVPLFAIIYYYLFSKE